MHDKLILDFFVTVILLLTITQVSFSQINIKGKLLNTDNIDGVHIVNSTSKAYAITNNEGAFEIKAKLNDTIKMMAIAFIQREVIITKKILENRYFEVFLNDAINQLDEVVVGKALTGELKKDMSLVEIEPKFSLNLSWDQIKDLEFPKDPKAPLINIASEKGKYVDGLNIKNIIKLLARPLFQKKSKTKIKEDQKEEFTEAYLIYYFGEDIFEKQLMIPEDKIALFLLYCWENEALKRLFNTKKDFKLLEKLLVLSKEFNELPE